MNTVVVSLYGGLGNQLFQYATGLALASQHQAELLLDINWFEAVKTKQNVTNRHYALSLLGVKDKTLNLSKKKGFLYQLARKLSLPIKNALDMPVYFEKSYHFDAGIAQLALPIHLDGYWQSYLYFESIKPLLDEQFTQVPRHLDDLNQAMFASIQSSHSVCVHIRRGDYVTNTNAAKHHGTCSIAYYQVAMKQMMQREPSIKFFIFSDDIPWVKVNLTPPGEHVFVDVNGDQDVHYDLWLMCACRDFIIANSSLSWWAAWLSQHPEKYVIAPENWFADGKQNTKDLIPESWKRLSIQNAAQ